ncbi:adhesion G-protein coupled receptor G2 [Kryptolebias marmoratus]|uniref:adhesion G-protein coupled receptor G2 n=1 Tax=Kryptolebias marmoratus TaxID=37003 RepID=UPI0007F92A38|nr:adhesion G-protein coupled receptor G2 [Kryptolebias marmoratus]
MNMIRHSWTFQLLLEGFLWIFLTCLVAAQPNDSAAKRKDDLKECLKEGNTVRIVADNFYGIINASKHPNATGDGCIIFLQKDQEKHKKLWKIWPQVEQNGTSLRLYISKSLSCMNVTVHALAGNKSKPFPDETFIESGPVNTKDRCCKKAKYDEKSCKTSDYNNKYIINLTNGLNGSDVECINCNNPIKEADEELPLPDIKIPLISEGSEEVDASGAAELMTEMGNLVSSMNGTSASLSLGKGVEGLLVRQPDTEDLNPMSFAYRTPQDKLNIIEDTASLDKFSRSVSVSKEAFQKAVGPNNTGPFVAVLRFLNMTQDENNSTVLGNEVLAVDMGAEIKNLTDSINVTFKEISYKGNVPRCQSWNGEGRKPNWTKDGCETFESGDGIICQCSHLTFFAILLTPINETISSADLKNLTILTQVGCGLSMFFLGVVLFMHFLLRKRKPSQTTVILIHLVLALFLLNFAFLINNQVAKMKSFVGCQVMAVFMHYFLLATFSWFAAQAFHICLHLYKGGQVGMRRYILTVSATAWILPAVVAVVLAILGKYGEQTIYADNPKDNVNMCWINDNKVHYIVNIGYYALVFLFTFSTAIITLSWLFCLTRTQKVDTEESKNGKSIVTILGLCCQLGISWGFAFFAYGDFRVPATYIFTILNSFQGFFLFIHYYRSTRPGQEAAGGGPGSQSSTSVSTLRCGLETITNPYMNTPHPKHL